MNSEKLSQSVPPRRTDIRRMPFICIADCSGSMEGERIRKLNGALRHFAGKSAQFELRGLDLCILSAGKEVRTEVGFRFGQPFEMPELTAEGLSPLNRALLYALDLAEARIAEYEKAGVPCIRPALILITDGNATDHEYEEAAVSRMRQHIENRRVWFLPCSVGGADAESVLRYYPENRSVGMVPELSDHFFEELLSWGSPSIAKAPEIKTELSPVPGIQISL